MIIRHIPVRAGRKSSLARLVKYITSKLGKHERLGMVQITNCHSQTMDWAITEMEATQAQNQRAVSDRTYHVLVSFPAGEVPTPQMLKDIEKEVCTTIGFGEHQRISAVHHDTDNMHIHIAINKIHPDTHAMHEPWLAYRTLAKTAERLEIKHGLQRTNHKASRTISENHAHDLEHHTGIESLLCWMRTNCLSGLQRTESWEQFHAVLAQHGLSIKSRGNGLVFTDNKGVFIKASTVARDLSRQKLEKRFGKFIAANRQKAGSKTDKKPPVDKIGKKPPPRSRGRFSGLNNMEEISFSRAKDYIKKPVITTFNTDELFKRYMREMADIRKNRNQVSGELKQQKQKAIARIKKNARLKRLGIQLLNEKGTSKRMLYGLVSKICKAELTKVNTQYQETRAKITCGYQWRTWVDWLKWQAANNDTEAVEALRARDIKRPLSGNIVSGESLDSAARPAGASMDSITKAGTIIWHTGNAAIRDDGNTLKVSGTYTEACLEKALDTAVSRFGKTICVNGSDDFREAIVHLSVKNHPDITFSDPVLERKRQEYQARTGEKRHADNRRVFKRTGTTGSSITNAARTHDGGISRKHGGNITKPHIERPGRKPPPQSQNRLRTMSELGMVQFADRSEVLLQGDVSRELEYEGTQSNHQLRRDVPGAGIAGLLAAEKYIAEREVKRLKGMDIFQHRLFDGKETRVFEYAGIRTVNNQNLLLLKFAEEVIVHPIERAMVQKLKKLRIGEKVNFSIVGISLTRGRKL